jgi:hypothetical protein
VRIINYISFIPQELNIPACILNGRGTKATGIRLSVSSKTIEVHNRNIVLPPIKGRENKLGSGPKSREKNMA